MATEFVPRDYQEMGIELLLASEEGALLAFPPGSGKTPTALVAADLLMHQDLRYERCLIVGPKLVAEEVWVRETKKWTGLQHLKIWPIPTSLFRYRVLRTTHQADAVEVLEHERVLGDKDLSRSEILARSERFMTVSRDNFWWLTKMMGNKWPWDLVIFDESTSLKTHDSQRSKAVRFLRSKGLIKFFVPLSGTPRPKSLEQFWSQIRLIDGGRRLGETLGAFRGRYMTPVQMEVRGRPVIKWKDRVGALDEAMAACKDICLSVRSSVWRKTEPPLIAERVLTLPDRARALYEELADRKVLRIGAGVTAPDAAVLAGKLLQLAAGFIYDDEGQAHWVHDEKIEALVELLEELEGEPVMVLYWHKAVAKRMQEKIKGLVSTKSKGFLDRFAAGQIKALALHPASAGHGLDGLQRGGHHVACVEMFPDWEYFQQAVSRLDRGGQEHRVTVHQFIAADTRDERICRILADGEACQERVIEALLRG